MLPNIARVAEVLDISPLELLPDDIVQVDAATRGRSVPALRKQLLSYRFVNPAVPGRRRLPRWHCRDLTRAVAAAWSGYQASRFGYVIAELHRLACPWPSRDAEADRHRPGRRADGVPVPAGGQRAHQGGRAGPGVHLRRPRRPRSSQDSRRPCRPRLGSADHRSRPACERSVRRRAGRSRPDTRSRAGCAGRPGAAVRGGHDAPGGRDGERPVRAIGGPPATTCGAQARLQTSLRRDANYLWTAFGPTNVAIHDVAVAAELGDYQRAAHLGQQVDPSPMPMERQVRHSLEVARALHFQRQQPDALALRPRTPRRGPRNRSAGTS